MMDYMDAALKLAIGLFIIGLLMFFFIILTQLLILPDQNKQLCNKLNMEVLSSSSGGLFSGEELTCWNPETKQIVKVK